MRKAREADRAAAMEQARLQLQREEEAEARRQARAAEKLAPVRKPIVVAPPSVAARATNGDVWRRPTPTNSVPATPTRASLSTPPRAESPSPAAPSNKYRPGALSGAAPGGWRAREQTKTAEAPVSRTGTPRPASPAPSPLVTSPKEDAKTDDDGFQKVPEKKAVWRPTRGRGRGL